MKTLADTHGIKAALHQKSYLTVILLPCTFSQESYEKYALPNRERHGSLETGDSQDIVKDGPQKTTVWHV